MRCLQLFSIDYAMLCSALFYDMRLVAHCRLLLLPIECVCPLLLCVLLVAVHSLLMRWAIFDLVRLRCLYQFVLR